MKIHIPSRFPNRITKSLIESSPVTRSRIAIPYAIPPSRQSLDEARIVLGKALECEIGRVTISHLRYIEVSRYP